MHGCRSLAGALLLLSSSLPTLAGSRVEQEPEPLVVLQGDLLEAGEADAPFAEPGPVLGGFVLRSRRHGDLRVDPGVARLHVRGGVLRARATEDPAADLGGLLELCRLGLAAFPCFDTLPSRPEPGYWTGGVFLPPLVELSPDMEPRCEEQALLGCGRLYVCHTVALPGDRSDVRSGGNTRFGRRDFVWVGPDIDLCDPTDLRAGMAALSWNLIMALVALSEPADPDAPSGTGGCSFANPSACANVDEFDPSQPFRTDGCSFANPAACAGVGGFIDLSGWRLQELPDDPRGGPREHWLWESAIAYEIVHAQGSLAGFRDGRVYVYGPFESPIEGSASGIGLLVVPPDGVVPETTPLVHATPGADRTLGTADDGIAGLAWGAAWSGNDGASQRGPKHRGRASGGAPAHEAGVEKTHKAGSRQK